MTIAEILNREKIVSLSQLQKNPAKALDASIVRIVKNGKEIGIFLTKQEFEDMVEEKLPIKASFKAKLDKVIKKSKRGKKFTLNTIL